MSDQDQAVPDLPVFQYRAPGTLARIQVEANGVVTLSNNGRWSSRSIEEWLRSAELALALEAELLETKRQLRILEEKTFGIPRIGELFGKGDDDDSPS